MKGNKMNIPENLPTLSYGAQAKGSGKMCAEQAVSWLAGEDWSDKPKCVQPVLNSLAVTVNDRLPDDQRYRMWPAILRQIGTARPDMEPVLSVRLAAFLAEHVLDLTRPQDREVCNAAISAARAWCDCPCKEHAYAAADAAYAAKAAIYAAYAATYAADAAKAAIYAAYAATYAADAAYAAYAAKAATYAADAAYAAYAADAVPDRLIKLLEDTQAECERLIGHEPQEIDPERWQSLCEMGQ